MYMNYSFEYIDIILLAMIAGFIFLRLRGILGKRSGFEGKGPKQFQEIVKELNLEKNVKLLDQIQNFEINSDNVIYDKILEKIIQAI